MPWQTVGLIFYVFCIYLNEFIDIESHSNQTVFAFLWFDSSWYSAAITLCTVLSKVINSGFSNQWLWLGLVCQINVMLWRCFYFIWHVFCVPLCLLLHYFPLTQSKEKMFPKSCVFTFSEHADIKNSYFRKKCVENCWIMKLFWQYWKA